MSRQLSHLVDNRWWPLASSARLFSVILVFLIWFKLCFNFFLGALSFGGVRLILILWLRDIIRERTFQGAHTLLVQGGLKWGLTWFLFREAWFFFSVFWGFFHFRLVPLTRNSSNWPNSGLRTIPPFQIPLLNTAVLLIRGVTVTLSHNEFLAGMKSGWLIVSVMLGGYFLALQGFEYYTALYSLASGTYGRVFFFGTGFHGRHVLLGVLMLRVRAKRFMSDQVRPQHHFGAEFGIWYWHFVDVVWLFLFFWVYAWGR